MGKPRVSVESIRRTADARYVFAGGAYVAGDCSLEEMQAGEKSAEALYRSIGETAPWKKKS
jgi:hypothetical protein